MCNLRGVLNRAISAGEELGVDPLPWVARTLSLRNSTTRRQGFKSDPPQPAPALRAGDGQGGPHGQTLAQARRSPCVDCRKFLGSAGRLAAYAPLGFNAR